MLDQAVIQRIKRDAIKLDWDVAFGGKARGNRHLFRINKIIKYLLTKEGEMKRLRLREVGYTMYRLRGEVTITKII